MKLLLHSCCAPCTIQCAAALVEEGLSPHLFWYNPNIHPFTEYRARRDTLRQYAGETGLRLLMEDEYGLRGFVGGLYGDGPPADGGPDCLKPPRRCAFCYRLRLEKTAAAAAAGAYDAFSTTLLISPYQAHELIRAAAEEAAARHGPAFLYRDFRPRFRQGREEGRARGYYMQKYCGCIFSEEERYLSSKEI